MMQNVMVFRGFGLAWTRISSRQSQLCAALLMPGAARAEVCDKEILWPVLDNPPYGLMDRIGIELTSPVVILAAGLLIFAFVRRRLWPVALAVALLAANTWLRWSDWFDQNGIYRLAVQEGCRAHPLAFTLATAVSFLAMAWLARRSARRRNPA
ncbi:hypothetical protein [Mesobacterium pallidum]|uniref:hypothetical protein n=1 Tax=Mesobacterium pallidum TaxID=2872037 RepID=UPI001EE39EFC|nr:hypothetical protein [Mesobacterium pallidum]